MTFSKTTLVAAGAVILAIAAVFLAFLVPRDGFQDDAPASARSREDIEKIVRNYLMENPEVIFEAAQRLEAKENEQRKSRMQENALAHAGDLFNGPEPIVAGNPNGDITIVEFFDYRCGPCRRLVNELAQLVKQDGNIRLIMKEFPILSKESEIAARAAIAAHRQGKYWDFHFAMMHADELTPESIMATAKAVGLDTNRLAADMALPKVAAVVERNHELARKLGIDATPTYFIGNKPYSGALPLSELKAAVAEARKAGKG